ncbi:MAG: S8 family serine peptidase [Bacillota bacterium]|nr:S8 family serine peptidase [Bacillota bacterium]
MKKLVALLLAMAMVLGLSALPAGAQSAQTNVIVSFEQKPGPNEQAIIHRFGGTVKHTYSIIPAIAAMMPVQGVEALQRAPGVLKVEPDVEVHAMGEIDNVWGVKQIGAGVVHAYNKGAGIKVAVIDSGIDYTHPDLNANYVGGYDWVNDDTDPKDDNGHGTHVAGTIAAEADGAGAVGVAPEAKLYALKVLNSKGTGSFSDIIAALQWCMSNGIQVTNNSYGSAGDPGTAVKAAFDNAYAAGIVHVAAAGNSGTTSGTGDNVIYPAKYSSVIAVAATDSSKQRAIFSSTGLAVELAAPGVSIYSTVPGGYAYYNGTSMASPHVAGTVALIIKSGVTSKDGIRQRLQATADDLGSAGRDPLYGFGLVDADEAAPATGSPVVTITSPANGAVAHVGVDVVFSGAASDPEDGNLSASLSWSSDREGAIGIGASVTHEFSVEGQRVITASVMDAQGNTGSSSVPSRL